MKKDIKLIAFDLDGTLADSNRHVSEKTLSVLRAFWKEGIYIVPATGRLFRALPAELAAEPFIHYGIYMNGGQVYDAKQGSVIHKDEIPLELAMRVYELLQRYPIAYDCYINDTAWIDRSFYDELGRYITHDSAGLAYSKALRTPIDGFLEVLEKNGKTLQKIQAFMGGSDLRPEIMSALCESFPELSVTYSLPYNIEINPVTATKGNALRMLCAHLGISTENVIAFGDGTNDISLLKTAGVGVAMDNGAEEVKSVADFIAPSNNEDGVAHFLNEYLK